MPNETTLAERMETIIEECGLKQATFAKSLGVTPNYISMIIHGKKELISPTLAILIEHIYGYSRAWILSGEGEKRNRDSLLKSILKDLDMLDMEKLKQISEYIKKL